MTKTIKEIISSSKEQDFISINGWVKTQRRQQELSFISITDGSTTEPFQIIVSKNIKNYDSILNLSTGCSVRFEGKIVKSPAIGQVFEMQASNFHIYGLVDDPKTYPVPMKRLTMEHLRDNAHLRSRTNLFSSVSRIRQIAKKAIDDFFEINNFIWVSTPILTSSDCEGAGEMFHVTTLDLNNVPKTTDGKVDYSKDFFKKNVNLTVSGQLNAETIACALTKVYTFGRFLKSRKT